MNHITATLTLVSSLLASDLMARSVEWGLDGSAGIHYNTVQTLSYKDPLGDFGGGVHFTFRNPEYPQPFYFNCRLTMENHYQRYTWGGPTLGFALRDVMCSFQMQHDLNDKFTIYGGLNLTINVWNTIRYETGMDTNLPQAIRNNGPEDIQRQVKQNIRRLNAGAEIGAYYRAGGGINIGLCLNYFVLKKMKEDIKLNYSNSGVQDVALNFRPVAFKLTCVWDMPFSDHS